MSIPEDHEVLDLIAHRLRRHTVDWDARRESECVEFRDPETGRWYEIVVRPIDGPSRGADEDGGDQ